MKPLLLILLSLGLSTSVDISKHWTTTKMIVANETIEITSEDAFSLNLLSDGQLIYQVPSRAVEYAGSWEIQGDTVLYTTYKEEHNLQVEDHYRIMELSSSRLKVKNLGDGIILEFE